MTTNAHTPTPWFVSGVRFKMNGGEWHSINRYDEANKRDENIACVGFDRRTGLGFADANFIVRAVNAHEELVAALRGAMTIIDLLPVPYEIGSEVSNAIASRREKARAILAKLDAAS